MPPRRRKPRRRGSRWLLRGLLLCVMLPLSAWAWLQSSGRTLPGLRIDGEALPPTSQPDEALQARAAAWQKHPIDIVTGPHLTRASRGDLGASRDPRSMAVAALALGRSGNPLLDIYTFAETLSRGHDLPWPVKVDRIALGRYLQAVRHNVERPPVAGARDDQGWSIAGTAGITLDTVDAVAALERLLRSPTLRIDLPLRQVPPPTAVAIGSPDAALYGQGEQEPSWLRELLGGAPRVFDTAQMAAAQPGRWLPSKGPQCDMDPPYERFCQGPRRVAMPVGAAAELGEGLGLGTVAAVSRLIGPGPRPEWVRAAGGPLPRPQAMRWPVPDGKLWRGFGYVRRQELRHKLHRGIDVGAPKGTPLIAVNDGLVAYSDNGVRGYGNLLVMVHPDGSVSLHAHCQAIYVFAGQLVRRGQILGEVGDTGIARGSHLHFEYHLAGEPTDPMDMFEDH